METLVCVDGPLQGRGLRLCKSLPAGRTVTALVEVEHGVMEAVYTVDRTRDAEGRLVFDGARAVAARPRRRLGAVPLVRL